MDKPIDSNSRLFDIVRLLAENRKTLQSDRKNLIDFFELTKCLPVENLDQYERAIRQEINFSEHRTSLFRGLLSSRKHRFIIPWLDLCNFDGYRRENALRIPSDGAPNAFLFAIMLRRLNDWVPEVRSAAIENIPTIAAKTNPEIIIAALWGILPNLTSWGRIPKREMETLLSLTDTPQVVTKIVTTIEKSSAGPAVFVLSQLSRNNNVDEFLPRLATSSIQPAVRAKIYKWLIDRKVIWLEGKRWVWIDRMYCKGGYEPFHGERVLLCETPVRELIAQAATDQSAFVRRVAASALIAHRKSIGHEGVEIATVLSQDRYPSVAERGQFFLSKLEESE